jgi:polyphosphate glucokinase
VSGLGSVVISEHIVLSMELRHLLYKMKHTFENYVRYRGIKRLGQEKWRCAVADVVARLKDALGG